jgi:hypothetical protein
MTRLEKAQLLKERGYTYDKETGKIYGIRGKEITNVDKVGYKYVGYFKLAQHHYAWFITYGNVDFIELDHIDNNPSNNHISNLRISNRNQQNQNKNPKGYYFMKSINKWGSFIQYDKKRIYLGYFNTEEEARNSYLEAKKKYHNL